MPKNSINRKCFNCNTAVGFNKQHVTHISIRVTLQAELVFKSHLEPRLLTEETKRLNESSENGNALNGIYYRTKKDVFEST